MRGKKKKDCESGLRRAKMWKEEVKGNSLKTRRGEAEKRV